MVDASFFDIFGKRRPPNCKTELCSCMEIILGTPDLLAHFVRPPIKYGHITLIMGNTSLSH